MTTGHGRFRVLALFAAAMLAIAVALAAAKSAGAVVPGANGKIFFSSDRDGDLLHVPERQGAQEAHQQQEHIGRRTPVSPDGTKIAGGGIDTCSADREDRKVSC